MSYLFHVTKIETYIVEADSQNQARILVEEQNLSPDVIEWEVNPT